MHKQHHMVVCDFTAHIPHVKKCKFSPCICIWKLRDPVTANQFHSALKLKVLTATAAAATTAGVTADTVNCDETVCLMLKNPLLDAATKVCSLSKDHQWRPETWWWNEQVGVAVQEKHAWFLKKGGKAADAREVVNNELSW